jgi:hypothetical protein
MEIHVVKIIFLLIITIIVSGCATVGSYQQDCEAIHTDFAGMVGCLKTSVQSDSRIKDDGRVRLYLLKAEQLLVKVKSKEIDELDARAQLQEIYVGLKNQETSERQRNAEIEALTKPTTTDTNCTVYGNSANCKTRQY